ncbi:rRNA methyltransferase 1, mitochondrial [Coccomyxa sp. Obi]|nr:rRNA methyltransferase 1, mitochondrial [Coccomyxa sp. Obi]
MKPPSLWARGGRLCCQPGLRVIWQRRPPCLHVVRCASSWDSSTRGPNRSSDRGGQGRNVDGEDRFQSDIQHNSNSSGWRPDLSEETPRSRAPRDSWGNGAWDRGSTRERQRGGRQGGGNNWGRERREGREGGQRWAPRDGPSASGNSPGSGGSLRNVLQGEALYGVNPVLGALQALRREVHTLYVQEATEGTKKKEGIPQAVAAMKERGGSIQYVSKHELNLVTDNKPHQGLVLDCSPLDWEPLDEFPAADSVAPTDGSRPPLWLALDEIGDPQNLGAAVRVAYFLGVAGVLCCARNSAPLSPAVSKASAGALEWMPLHACRSMPRTLSRAAECGWHVVGAGGEADAQTCRGVTADRPTILVMGNEGRGLRPVVRRACAAVLRIDSGASGPGSGRHQPIGVDSLNVSVATGILLHQLLG